MRAVRYVLLVHRDGRGETASPQPSVVEFGTGGLLGDLWLADSQATTTLRTMSGAVVIQDGPLGPDQVPPCRLCVVERDDLDDARRAAAGLAGSGAVAVEIRPVRAIP